MAKIPVERETQGGGWWKWLLGIVAVVLLGWIIWAWADDDEVELAIDEGVETVEEPFATDTAAVGADTAATAAGVITDASTIFTAEDRSALVNRDVRLSGMHVREVPGDSVFYVSPQEGVAVSPENRIIIASLDEVIPEPPPGVEGRYDVTEDQTLTIYGSVQRIQQEHPTDWGVTQQAQQLLEQDQVYVRAQRLEITELPQGNQAQTAP